MAGEDAQVGVASSVLINLIYTVRVLCGSWIFMGSQATHGKLLQTCWVSFSRPDVYANHDYFCASVWREYQCCVSFFEQAGRQRTCPSIIEQIELEEWLHRWPSGCNLLLLWFSNTEKPLLMSVITTLNQKDTSQLYHFPRLPRFLSVSHSDHCCIIHLWILAALAAIVATATSETHHEIVLFAQEHRTVSLHFVILSIKNDIKTLCTVL